MEKKSIFKTSFEKVAGLSNLLKTIPKAARSVGAVTRMSRGVGELAEEAASLAKRKASSALPKAEGLGLNRLKSRGNAHARYLESIGATHKPNMVEGQTLKYRPSSTRAGLSEFSAITGTPKTRINGERGPIRPVPGNPKTP